MNDHIAKATKAAIRHAKYRKSPKVDKDDLLIGILQVISRFDIVQIGPLAIDLQDFEGVPKDGFKKEAGNIKTQKVAYSSSANTIFEKAAYIARTDNSKKVEIIHFLVAFADESTGLMAELKEKYAFSGREWRAMLSNIHSFSAEKSSMKSETSNDKFTMGAGEKQFFSPDEAAVFLGMHVQTIRGYIRTGKLPALRLAGERALRIKREDLLALLEPFKPE